jgi:hypothetical protein
MINADKTDLWKDDLSASVHMHNDWFLRAPLDGSRIRAIIRTASQPGESSDLVEQVLAVA